MHYYTSTFGITQYDAIREGKEKVEEEELQKMPYSKAMILGLRCHPQTHFAAGFKKFTQKIGQVPIRN